MAPAYRVCRGCMVAKIARPIIVNVSGAVRIKAWIGTLHVHIAC